MSPIPNSFVRGIQKLEYINIERDTVLLTLFLPDQRTKKEREDQGQETSINWEDDDTVLSFTHHMSKENNSNSLAFPHGAVRLRTEVLNEVNTTPATANSIIYERQPLKDNPFHGNIVFKDGIPQHIISMAAAVLAYSAGKILRK